ncbi:MAG TPA: FtsX-like permease family protein [Gemmatimonadaceae bacterium]|jgi:putative ABC transport system permease protein|nr:FtsX-like permease family protein [Gemmatimonadaceae bacterium]
MSATRQLLALAWRESRTARRRLLLYMSSISLGVAALVAIDSFSENTIRSVHEQSRALMGGDVAARRNAQRGPAIDSLVDSLARAGISNVTSTGFSSMALVPRSGGTRLVQVHAVSAGYPFYGNIVTDPVAAWSQIQGGANAIVDPALLVSLDAQLGDTLSLGSAKFVITGSLRSVPGDVGISAAIGPRVYIPERYVPATGLVVFGSRVEYETLFKLPATLPSDAFVKTFGKRLAASNGSVQSAGYNESRLASAIDQLHDYLAIVGLIALLLGGIGVASGVHAFVMRKIDPVAILRCVGATSWQVLAIYSMQAAVMGLVGAAAGVVFGLGIQFAMPYVLHDFLPVDVELHLAPRPIVLGLGIGVWVALLFSLRPLVALRRVSPLQALRREPDADALRRARWDPLRIGLSLAIAASVLALGLSRANTPRRGIGFTLAIAGAIGILWLSAAGLSWAARRLIRPSWPFPLRQGIASLYRPGNQTRAVVLALGFGVFLMGTLYQVQYNILRSLDLRLGEARANVVFFDVQENQQPGIDSVIRAAREELIDETPIVAMRVASVNGKSATAIADEIEKNRRARDSARVAAGQRGPGRGARGGEVVRDRRGPWVFRREFRSTFRDTLTASERLVSGKWFGAPGNDVGSLGEVSLDSGVAVEMGVKLRDTITWNVQGVLIPTIVTSLRSIQWQTFAPNFFAVFDPKSLSAAPKQYAILVHASSPTAIAHLQRDVVARYPSISSLDLTLVQRTVQSVLGKVTMAVRFLALISLGLAVPVLFSAVAATRRDRLREGVLLKTLGATRRQIARIMLAEYALLGTLGALTGVLLSTLAAWGLLHVIFRMPFMPAFGPASIVAAAMIGLAVSIGLLTGRDVFAETPMAALRET